MEELLKNIADFWLRQFEAAKKAKNTYFAKTAGKLWKFLGASWTDLYTFVDPQERQDYQFPDADQSFYKGRINLSAKYVAVMGPYVNARVPHRLVTPDRPPLPQELLNLALQQQAIAAQAQAMGQPMPMLSDTLAAIAEAAPNQQLLQIRDQVRAFLIQWLLQWLPEQYGLVRESKMAVIEALVKGMGIVWLARTDGPTGEIPISEYDSIDHYFLDGDCKRRRDAGFIFRKRREATWRVAEKYGVSAEKLRAAHKSNWARASEEAATSTEPTDPDAKRDICEYVEVWSRVGLGQRFYDSGDKMKEVQDALEEFGPYVHLAVMEGVPHPLNLPPHLFEDPLDRTAIERAIRWPIETYEDLANPWPCNVLEFIPYADNPYAQSPLEPALPLQVFLDHIYAFVMGAIRRRSKSTVVTSDEMERAFREAITYGLDMEVVVKTGGVSGAKLNELFHVIDYGKINPDLWTIIPIVEHAFEEMTGLTPLLSHGGVGATQPRSATEMAERSERAQSRPDEYADCVEAWQSAISKSEAVMTRLYVGSEVVAPLFGEEVPQVDGPDGEPIVYDSTDPASIEALHTQLGPLSRQWGVLVNTNDPAVAAGEFSYTVEAGSGRRKNRQKQVADLQSIGQMVVPFLTQVYTQTGIPTAVHGWIRMMGEALDVDVTEFVAGIPDMRAEIAAQQQQEAEAEEEQPSSGKKEESQ